MGKIILSERQYSKLKKSLVSHSITESIGKKSNPRLINEALSEDDKLTADSVGKKIQQIYVDCGIDKKERPEGCFKRFRDQLSRLKNKEMFDYASQLATYWYKGNWPRSIGYFIKYMIDDRKMLTNAEAIKNLSYITPFFTKAGGDLKMPKINDEQGEPKINKPETFTLTWKSKTSSPSTPTTSGTAAVAATPTSTGYKSSIVCPGADFDKYWPVFKKQVDFFLWGCKEGQSTKFSSVKTAQQYKCPAGITFYSYETQDDPDWAYSNQTDIGWKSNKCYAGEPFKNVSGTDDNKKGMTLAQFISQNTSQQQPTKTQTTTAQPQTQQATQKPQVQPKSYTGGGGSTPPPSSLSYLDEF